jgi:RNA polymerase sigma-70 factor (ECF subfamily)
MSTLLSFFLGIPLRGTAPGTAAPDGDDRALLERAGRHDAVALRTIYDRHSGRVMAVALRILASESEAEEIVQETFVEVWRRAAQYDALRGSVGTWITSIARNRAIDRVRSRQARGRMMAEVQGQASMEPAAVLGPGPLELIEQRQAREQLASALEALPGEQRAVLELAYFEGLTQTEIAERTGQPLGTVKTRVRRAVERLAGLIGPLPAGGSKPGGTEGGAA